MNATCTKKCFQPTSQSCKVSAALLLLRIVVGVAFVYHGWGKIQTPFSWMPPESPVPGFFQFLAALSEFGGGISLILGVITPLAMAGLGFTMLVATCMHKFVMNDPFINMTGGSAYELPLVYLCVAILFLVIGPGKYSLDSKIFGNK